MVWIGKAWKGLVMVMRKIMRKGLSFLLTLAMVLGMFTWGPFVSTTVASAAESIPEEAMTPGDSLAYHGDVSRTAIGLKRAKNSSYYGGVYAYDFKLKNKKSNSIMTSYWGMYGSAAKLGASVSGGTALDITKENKLGSNVTVSMNFTGMKNANIIRVGYVIKNAGSSAQTVTVGGTVDTDIAGDDYAKIENFQNGSNVGLISTARGGEYLSFSTDGDYWYGRWTSSEVNNSTFASFIQKAAGVRGKDPNLRSADGTYDSCMNWLWKSVSVPAGSTVTKYCYWGVGDVTAGDDPAEIKTAAAPAAVTWDANAGGDSTVRGIPSGGRTATDDNNNITLPTLTRNGYVFEGWYNQAAGGTLIGAGGAQYHTESNVTLYAHWRAIISTVNVNLYMGADKFTGQTVQLYQDGRVKHNLTEGADEGGNPNGAYKVDRVANGTYDVAVDGVLTGDKVVVATTASDPVGKTVEVNVRLTQAKVNTKLDGTLSNVPGTVTLCQNGKVVGTLRTAAGEDGIWKTGIIAGRNTSFDIYVGGVDTGLDITTSNPEQTIEFYTVSVKLTDDEPWTTATVTLRDASGKAVANLPYVSTAGNVTTYSKILQKSNTECKVDVGGIDTGARITVGATDDNNVELTFYTATINVTCSDASNLPMQATMKGAGRTYAFKKGTVSGDTVPYTVQHVLSGPDYQIVTTGISTEGVEASLQIKDDQKTVNLTVHTINFQKYTPSSDNTTYTASDSGIKNYVIDGAKGKGTEIYLSGYTFDGWSETPWTDGNNKPTTDPYTAFDFTAAITRDVTLYPHYLPPTVKINGIVRTNADGTVNTAGSDVAYRLGNLVISGFDQSDESIRYVIFGGTNIEKIEAKDLPAGATYDEASKVLEFSPLVSMAEAQDCVRNHIIITPTRTGSTNNDGTITVTVLDKNGNLDSGSSSAPTQYGAGVSALPVTAGSTLSAGCFYYLRASTVITSTTAGQSALNVATGNPVYLYIPSDVTLTVKGGDAGGTTGAGAGIKVPSGATLYLLGEGSLVATGGAAENGQNGGQNKKDALFYGYDSNGCRDGFYRAGTGGAGGAGGGGAGAGIGGTGGNGGAGGTCAATTSRRDSDRVNGSAGGNGGDGTNGSASGSVYICGSMSVTATGGAAGSNGSAATKGTSVCNFYLSNSDTYNSGMANFACRTTETTYWANFYCAGPGGIGGYGIGGGAASNIGGGGAGGAGGGAGGQGAFAKVEPGNANPAGSMSVSADEMSSGGNGKNGGVSGHNSGTTYSGPYKNGGAAELKTGGQGGAGGTNGYKGSDGSYTVASTAKLNGSDGTSGTAGSFTIIYEKANSSDTYGTPSKTSYIFGREESFILPTYTPASSDKIFRGWRLTTYGVELGGVSGNPLASNEGKIYPSGAVLPISSTMAGNLTFTAVVAAKEGLYAEDTANYTATKLKTYTVTTTVDGEPRDVGELLFGGEKVRGLNGVYVYSTTSTNVTVKAGAETIAEMTASDENLNASATAEFENIKVTVTGYKPSDVTLASGPVLTRVSEDDTNKIYVYESPYRLVSDDKGDFAIRVDGSDVNKKTAYGQNTTVAYHTLTIKLEPSTARNVILKDREGNQLVTQKVGDGPSNTFVYTKLADPSTVYDVYADGTLTGATGVKFDSTREVKASYYVASVKVTLNGAESDVIGNPYFGTDLMIRNSVGNYTYASASEAARDLIVSGEVARKEFAADGTVTLAYFSINYQKNEGSGETGKEPMPTYCLSGGKANLAACSIRKGVERFAGWAIDDKIYASGGEISIKETKTAKPVWEKISLNELDKNGKGVTVIFDQTVFGYDGAAHTPEIKVYYGVYAEGDPGVEDTDGHRVGDDRLLTKDTDYTVSYSNDNESTGAGGDTVRAGEVTVSVAGKGDYVGVVTKTYTILPRLVTLKGVTASKSYDGTTDVTLNYSGASLDGRATVDNNNSRLSYDSTKIEGYIDSAEIETDEEGNIIAKPLRIRIRGEEDSEDLNTLLTGTSKTNYALTGGITGDGGESIMVTMSKKKVMPSEISVYNKTYDGTTGTTIIEGSVKFAQGDVPEGEEFKIIGNANFENATPGKGKNVTITNMELFDADGKHPANYELTTGTASTAGGVVKAADIVKASQGAPEAGTGYEIENGQIKISQEVNESGDPQPNTHYEILRVYPGAPEGTPGDEVRKIIKYNEGPVDIDSKYTYYIRWERNTNFESSEYTEIGINYEPAEPMPEDGKGTIDVTIENDNGAGKEVTVSIENGNTKLDGMDQTVTVLANLRKEVVITDLPYGSYNVVVRTNDNTYTATHMVSVITQKAVTTAFKIPNGKLATRIDIQGGDTPNAAVDGLNDILTKEDKDQAAAGAQDVEVALEVENVTANGDAAEGAAELRNLASGEGMQIDMLLDISLFKTVKTLNANGETTNTEKTNIGCTNSKVLEIAIPYEEAKTKKVLMFRYHDGQKQKLDECTTKPVGNFVDGTFFVDKIGGWIHLFASGYSTYAIATANAGGTGIAASTATPTATPTAAPTTDPTTEPTVSPEPTKTPETDDVTKNGRTAYSNELSLNSGLKVSQPGKKITVQIGGVPGANRYEVYATYCGMKFGKKATKVVKKSKVTTVKIKKLHGKKLNLKKNYKLYVIAYKVKNGVKHKLAKSITAHIVGRKNTKYSNPKKIIVKKTKIKLKKKKTYRLKPKVKVVNKKRKSLSDKHAPKFRYASSNKKIATVTKNGKIKAKKKGTCIIYIYAKNGYAKKIRVTVR